MHRPFEQQRMAVGYGSPPILSKIYFENLDKVFEKSLTNYLKSDIIILDKQGGVNMTTVSATELQNNFGKYLQYVQTGNDVIILRNGKEVARLISHDKSVSFLTDSLLGVLKGDYSEESINAERMRKYESID